jgi:hypothetical protein
VACGTGIRLPGCSNGMANNSSTMPTPDNLQKKKHGAKKKDLSSRLGMFVWLPQAVELNCIVSNGQQLYWVLPCGRHLRFMTIQAAHRQITDPKHPNMLSKYERCSVGPYKTHPEPQPDDKHRSYHEVCTWRALENAMCMPDVVNHIMSTSATPYNMLVGEHLGYVVEAKVVKHWAGGVDIFVPGLNLIIQVDGEHHDDEVQQGKDVEFMLVAMQQHFNVLRVHHSDVRCVQSEVDAVVAACMRLAVGSRPIAKCSMRHVLLQHPKYLEMQAP